MNHCQKIAGAALAAAVILIWGITFVCTKSLLADFSALEILFVRFVIAYFGLWILSPRGLPFCGRRAEATFALMGLTGVVLYQFLENVAIHFTGASNVSIIVSICPIFAALFSRIFLHEKTSAGNFILGFLISITGVTLVSFNDVIEFHISPKGDFAALGSAVSWGLYSLCVSKINAAGYSHLAATRRIFFYALLFTIPLAVCGTVLPAETIPDFFRINWSPAENAARFSKLSSWGNLLFLGLFASAGCFAAWNKACGVLGTVCATAGLYLIPVVTVVFAFLILGEKMTPMSVVGSCFTLAGVVVSTFRCGKKRGRD